MSKELKTLAEHNAGVFEIRASQNSNGPRPNGIACPKCGEELKDTEPMVTLTSDPPQKDVHCDACGYRGYRFC